jgi:hypothetical protein
VIARLRLAVPDRPGSLGAVASAIGAAGADIVAVEVLETESGRALDDVTLDVSGPDHLERVTARLARVPGVDLLGVQQPAPPVSGHAELELVAGLVAQPDRVLQTLVDGAPVAGGADWAALLDYAGGGAGEVLAGSPACPPTGLEVRAPLRLGAVRLGPVLSGPRTAAALVPLPGADLGLLLVRADGPSFSRSELWRMDQVARLAATLVQVPTG